MVDSIRLGCRTSIWPVTAAEMRAVRRSAIRSITFMFASEQWIPIEGVHELPLLQALVAARRRFIKPLRYDARHAAVFANALLLDTGGEATALHVLSPFLPAREREAKAEVLRHAPGAWVWSTDGPMPPLPALHAKRP